MTFVALHCRLARLTRVYDGLEGEVTSLCVKGELVNVHATHAEQHLVVRDLHQAVGADGDVQIRRGFVLLGPVGRHFELVAGGGPKGRFGTYISSIVRSGFHRMPTGMDTLLIPQNFWGSHEMYSLCHL